MEGAAAKSRAEKDLPPVDPNRECIHRSPGLVVKLMHRAGNDTANSAPCPFLPLAVGRHHTSVIFSADSYGAFQPPSRFSRSCHADLTK